MTCHLETIYVWQEDLEHVHGTFRHKSCDALMSKYSRAFLLPKDRFRNSELRAVTPSVHLLHSNWYHHEVSRCRWLPRRPSGCAEECHVC